MGLSLLLLWLMAAPGCGSKTSTVVTPPAQGTLTISPDSAVVSPGNQTRFTATARNGDGTFSADVLHWLSGDTTVAAVDSSGVVTGRALGRATITVRTRTLEARAVLKVISDVTAPVRVEIFPGALNVLAGDRQPVAAAPRDSRDLYVNVPITWTTDNSAVASVDTAGEVFANQPGVAHIRANVGQLYGECVVTVSAGPAVTVFAGSGIPGLDDGPASSATFDLPVGLAVDSLGSVYVADFYNNAIRVIENGAVRTLAGGSVGFLDGNGSGARFHGPVGVAVGPGRRVYVADRYNHAIRRVDRDGNVTTVAGQGIAGFTDSVSASEALFSEPAGVAVDRFGTIYVADLGNQVVRSIRGGYVGTVCGTPQQSGHQDGTPGVLHEPIALCLVNDASLYVVDKGDQSASVRKVAVNTGAVTTVAGNGIPGNQNGPADFVQFKTPYGVAVGPDGWLYVADGGNRQLRAVSPTGFGSTLGAVNWSFPAGIVYLPSGDLLVSDAYGRVLRSVHGTLHLEPTIWPSRALRMLPRPRFNLRSGPTRVPAGL